MAARLMSVARDLGQAVIKKFQGMSARHDEGELARLAPWAGGAIVALAWLGLLWDADSVRLSLSSVFGAFPSLAEFGTFAGLAVLMLGALGVVGHLALTQRRLTRMAAELRLRDSELADMRDRLRRHVADIERIADVASHDLQEPLRRMVAYAQLLEAHDRGREDEEARLYLSHVVDGARRMKALVSGLRAFVSVDSLPVSEEKTASLEALSVARKRLGDVLASADAALIVDPLPEVIADHPSLVEIFTQLLDNAARFRAESRRPVIHVSAVCDQGMARFCVADNGRGIEAARVARMFEIFYRPHDAAQSHVAGIGMGLAVVRRLVERLGGEVWVNSEIGKGSGFGFSLPLAGQNTDADREASAA